MAIKIHPIQERLRHGKNPPPPKMKPPVDPKKGVFKGLCNRSACLAPGAVFYNSGSLAYYCRDCALDLHKANIAFMTDGPMLQLEIDNNDRNVTRIEDVEDKEDMESLYNYRAEQYIQSDWKKFHARG